MWFVFNLFGCSVQEKQFLFQVDNRNIKHGNVYVANRNVYEQCL